MKKRCKHKKRAIEVELVYKRKRQKRARYIFTLSQFIFHNLWSL